MISPSNCANYRVIGIAPSCYRYRTIALPCHYNNVIALSRHRIVIVFAVLHHRFNVIALSRHRTIYTMIDGAMMWLCITRPYPDSIEMSFWYFYIPFFQSNFQKSIWLKTLYLELTASIYSRSYSANIIEFYKMMSFSNMLSGSIDSVYFLELFLSHDIQ